jgi:EAL domain-containing protein (putative c-di-GMP-specific phosphodiesterase class I)
MLEAIATVHPIDGQDLRITTCIGISVYPDDGLDAETLLKNADIAMYHAKEDGHSGFEFFHPDMNLQAVERQLLEADLRRAFENKELSLHYQPKIDLKTGAITGAEALIRWTHPTLGPISPAKFIPIAEACGLIVPIGARVLREACEQARSWIDLGLPALTMAVNVSAVRFQGEDFLEGILAVLAQTGLDPNSLELEVTESLLMKRPERTASTLHALRKKGVRIAIDDFGTGYSSLSYLHKLPLDVLKIDQSFIQKITTNPNQIGIVSAVIYMAKSLKLKVIAEGVETAEELAFLQAQDCDEAQGYYFSRPVPPEQFAKLLQTGIRL